MAACGSPQKPAERGPTPFGHVGAPALWVSARPDVVRDAFNALDRRIDNPALATGPLREAWQKGRAQLEDWLGDLGGGALPGGLPAEWGLDPTIPVQFSLGAAGGVELPRKLLGALRGGVARSQAPVMHARITVGLKDFDRLRAALTRLAARGGLESGAPTEPQWLVTQWPKDVFFIARDPEDGAVWIARRRAASVSLDLVWMAGPDGALDATIALLKASSPARPTPGLVIAARTTEVAALDAAIMAADILQPRAVAPPRAVIEAGASVVAACAERWATLAEVTDEVMFALEIGDTEVTLVAEAHLTAPARRRWSAALRPLPVRPAPDAGAGFALGLARDPFVAQPWGVLGPAWMDDVQGCPLGRFAPVLALGALPAWSGLDSLPVPSLSWAWPSNGVGAAAVWWQGFQTTPLGPIPTTAFVATLESEWNPPAKPLGEDGQATQDEAGQHWRLEDADVPMQLTRHAHAVSLGVGRGAGESARARYLPSCGTCKLKPTFLEAHLDPAALARGLANAGEVDAGVTALAAAASHFGRLVVTGRFADGIPRIEAKISGWRNAPLR